MYKIHQWNPIKIGNKTTPQPVLYIKPDKRLFDLAKENNFNLVVQVQNSNSNYDNVKLYATLHNSGMFPDIRPNFYNKTGYYSVLLDCTFNGYPPNNGMLKVYNINLDIPKKVRFNPNVEKKELVPFPSSNVMVNDTTKETHKKHKAKVKNWFAFIGMFLGIILAIWSGFHLDNKLYFFPLFIGLVGGMLAGGFAF